MLKTRAEAYYTFPDNTLVKVSPALLARYVLDNTPAKGGGVFLSRWSLNATPAEGGGGQQDGRG